MTSNDKDIERSLLRLLADRLGPDRFDLWFGPGTRILVDTENERIRLLVPSRFLADWIRANFRQVIDEAFRELTGNISLPYRLEISYATAAEIAKYSTGIACTLPSAQTVSATPLVPASHLAVKTFPTTALAASPVSLSTVTASSALNTLRGNGADTKASFTLPSFPDFSPVSAASETTVSPTLSRPHNPGTSSSHPSTLAGEIHRLVTPSLGAQPRHLPNPNIPPPKNASKNGPLDTRCNPRGDGREFSTLATFVKAPSNRLARQAVNFAIEYPGQMNPIYIYGETSLGKTHLLEGIWSELRNGSRRETNGGHPHGPVRRPGQARKMPLYMTAEQFTNAFLDSLRHSGMPAFRNKFRDISALLIDDLPFLAGKNQTQTELVHLFDTLKGRGVQIVFTGDRPLGQLVELRSEILSRIEAGIACEIKAPEPETLLTIFRQMVRRRGIPIPDEVCRFVATRLNSHARQLSGALNRLHAVHLSTGEPITVSVAEETLDDLLRSSRRPVRMQDIEKAVCEAFGLLGRSLQSKSRAKVVVQPRMLAMWLARKYTRNALAEIGRFFGNRSHSTVITAQKNVEKWLDADTEISCGDEACPVSEAIRRIERNLL